MPSRASAPGARRVAAALLVGLIGLAGSGCGGAGEPAQAPSSSGGSNGGGAAGASGGSPKATPTGKPVRVDCGDFSTCALDEAGNVYCWGRNKQGELGDGGGGGRARAVSVAGLGHVRSLALASQFACALQEDHTIKCWGTGRIANDGRPRSSERPLSVAALSGAEDLVASGVIACARTGAGIACWGADPSTIGTPPSGAFKQIATGFTHGCALSEKGEVTCWGTGDWGGRGAFASPSLSGASAVVTGDRHACVIDKARKVQCWGQNDVGQLGIKSDSESHKKPVVVPGVDGVTKLVAGESSTCALTDAGTARCWGSNAEGELGLGRRSSDERAQKLSLDNVADVCLATTHGCALTRDGKIYCWGGNAEGQLGDGTKERRLTPSPILW